MTQRDFEHMILRFERNNAIRALFREATLAYSWFLWHFKITILILILQYWSTLSELMGHDHINKSVATCCCCWNWTLLDGKKKWNAEDLGKQLYRCPPRSLKAISRTYAHTYLQPTAGYTVALNSVTHADTSRGDTLHRTHSSFSLDVHTHHRNLAFYSATCVGEEL
jgi:hypothetical protein